MRDSGSFPYTHLFLHALQICMQCEVEVSFALLCRDSVSNYSLAAAAAADRLQLETTVRRVSVAHSCLDWSEHKARPAVGSALHLSCCASEGSRVKKCSCQD